MGARKGWWKAPAVRRVRRRISDGQLLLWPVTTILADLWFATLLYTERWTESGPLAGYIERGEPVILCAWHEDVVNSAGYLLWKVRRYPITLMVGDGRAGSFGGYIVGHFGMQHVRAPKHHDGGRVGTVQRLAEYCTEHRCSAFITGDGSRGPAFEARWGAVYLARDTGMPIVPIRTWTRPSLVLPFGWLRLALPVGVPGGHAHTASGEPLYVPADATREDLEGYRQELEQRMNALREVCDTRLSEQRRAGNGVPWGLRHL